MSVSAKPDEKRVDLVFEGGGVKGIGLAGAFGYLDQQGYLPQRVAGTSAGAITAALVAAGYDGDELKRLVLEEMRFKKFEDGGHWPISQGLELYAHRGLHPGKYFEGWMREMLGAKKIVKFGDLRQAAAGAPDPGSSEPAAGADDAGLQYRLQVIASDVSRQRMLVLPRDAREQLGTDPDELDVALAVRMSMSIPIFFDPVTYVNPQDAKDEHVIVDGGLLSNFPVWLFDCPPSRPPEWPTFGMLLAAPHQADPLVPGPNPATTDQGKMSIRGFLLGIVHTMMEAHDRLYVEQANYARTIPIGTLGVKTTQFEIDDDPQLKQRLYDSGRDAAREFLAGWDFDAYIRAFRSGAAQPSRRERVAAVLARS